MMKAIIKACTKLFDTLLPPRRTQRLIRNLELESLRSLAGADGTLPYHDERITALVWELKYRKNAHALALAGAFLAEHAMAFVEESLSPPILIPVPMHESRRKARGYNQTEKLCEAIVAASPASFAYAPTVLARVRNTIPQQGLPRYRRLKNIQGAIEAKHPEEIAGKTCLIVDDVSTTGATVHETKRALLDAGAKEVHILILAHS